MKKSSRILIFILCCWFSTMAVAARLIANVDRHVVNLDETFKLTITADGRFTGKPNFQKLNKNFVIFGEARGHALVDFNGNISDQTTWTMTLQPRHAGHLTIPSLILGNLKTKPIKIQVKKVKLSNKNKDIFFQASVEPKNAYVNSQLVYIVKLYSDVDVRAGSLTPPSSEHANIIPIDENKQYQATQNGRIYQVLERRYLIFPQKTGNLDLVPPVLVGVAVNPFTGNNPFFQGQTGKPIRLVAPKIRINIKPIPRNAHQPWLPAKSFVLTEHWSNQSNNIKIGSPITRTITMQAVGLRAEQLPSIVYPKDVLVNQYPDKPILKTKLTNSGVLGSKVIKLAIIPTAAGKFTIPELKIHWWNTQTNRPEVVTLPAHHFSITPAIENSQAKEALASNKNTTKQEPANSIIKNTEAYFIAWLVAGLFGLLWLLTLWGWLRNRKNNKSNEPTSPQPSLSLRQSYKDIKACCYEQDPQATQRALLVWARQYWLGEAIHNLGDIAEKFNNFELSKTLGQLDAKLYHDHAMTWDGKRFWKVFSKQIGKKKTVKNKQAQTLPPLYPDKH